MLLTTAKLLDGLLGREAHRLCISSWKTNPSTVITCSSLQQQEHSVECPTVFGAGVFLFRRRFLTLLGTPYM